MIHTPASVQNRSKPVRQDAAGLLCPCRWRYCPRRSGNPQQGDLMMCIVGSWMKDHMMMVAASVWVKTDPVRSPATLSDPGVSDYYTHLCNAVTDPERSPMELSRNCPIPSCAHHMAAPAMRTRLPPHLYSLYEYFEPAAMEVNPS